MVEDLEVIVGLPNVLLVENERFNAAPAASFSFKNIPTLGDRSKLNAEGLSVFVPATV